MGNWLDKTARKQAQRADEVGPATADGDVASGLTRRDALRRAGVVGAAVWALPVVDSVMSPAFAVSPGPGATCKHPSDHYRMCGGSKDPNCPPCDAKAYCDEDSDCVTQTCIEKDTGKPHKPGKKGKGVCGPSYQNGKCYESSDCVQAAPYGPLVCTSRDEKHIGRCRKAAGTQPSGGCTTNHDCGKDEVCNADGVCVTKKK